MQPLFVEIQLGLLKLDLRAWLRGRKLALPAGGQKFNSSTPEKPKINKQKTQNKTKKQQETRCDCTVQPGESAWLAPRSRTLCACTGFVGLQRRDHIRGPVAAARLPWYQGGWQASQAEGRARRIGEAAQRCRYEPGHHRSGLGDGKEAWGGGRKGARWQPAPAGRLLPHKSQLRASAATVPAPQQPLAPACARGGHYFQEAPGTAPSRTRCGSEAEADRR